ncbi:helix-turn-helix domain-containing protein [Petropleomorpha daqingensis]|uniref:Transposase n=1 Tax=Petropleomorpha daqingensis TaxID=2026353 RepID=A0A853CLZ5_9ACTN|nr:helix-turn-helix domain-containing protein [Petropleomorpha daqingensis]NYJ07003.1 transposase [Petropleomorpha daqingensis]
MTQQVQVRPISTDEGNRLLRIVRRGTGSVVTWRRAQMVLLSAQRMPVAKIAAVTFTSPDRVRDVLHNFNTDGFDSLYPRYAGGRPPRFDLKQRNEIKKIALSRPADHELPFSTWSLAKLADFLVAEGVVDDISHEGLRAVLRDADVSFQAVKTWKSSTDPDWAPIAAGRGDPAAPRRRRRRAVYFRTQGVRHLLAALDLHRDRLYGHVKTRKGRTQFLAFCRYLRALYPPEVRLGIVLDNYSPHLSTRKDDRVGRWALENNVEFAYVPFYCSWLNRIEPQFTALRYFTLDGTDHQTHAEQGRMIRRYIAWRNQHATDPRLRKVIKRASTIKRAKVA